MKSWNVIFGVDVSKLTLDICCAERSLHVKIDNCSKGFEVFRKWCKTQGISLGDCLMVMEFTGGYEYRFIQFCQSLSIPYCRIPGLEIKQSMGMTRGKATRLMLSALVGMVKKKVAAWNLQSRWITIS
jgi:transposase